MVQSTRSEATQPRSPVCQTQAFDYFSHAFEGSKVLYRIRAFHWLPEPSDQAAPVVLFNHGGISGVNDNSKKRGRELCLKGYAVFASSYRGEDGSQGEIEVALGEVDDVLALHEWIKTQADALHVDSNRTALVGFSHGALVGLQAAKRAPRNFRAMVFAYGVSDIYRWVQHLRDTRQFGADPLTLRIYGRGPHDKPEEYAKRFGLSNLDRLDPNLKTLIVQGKRDTLVPWNQATLLADALTKAKRQQETALFEHATHAFLIRREALSGREKADADAAWQRIYLFLADALAP
jgi:dienelactone hydrolase